MTNAKILCVEDEPELLENLSTFLQIEHFEVVAAKNGREGVQKFHDCKPDIVLCDIRMPDMNGLDMLEAISQSNDAIVETPFIFLTAYDDAETHCRARRLGCDDFLVKPVNFDLLLASMHSRLVRCGQQRTHYHNQHKGEQSSLMQTLGNHVIRPVHSLLAYTDLLSDDNETRRHEYVLRIQDMAHQHLDDIQALIEIMTIFAGEPVDTNRNTSLTEALCRAYACEYNASDVAAGGMARIQRLLDEKLAKHLHVCETITLASFRRLFHALRSKTSLALPEISFNEENDTLVLSILRQPVMRSVRWKAVESVTDLTGLKTFKSQDGLTILHTFAACRHYPARLEIAKDTSQNWQGVRLTFASDTSQ